MSNFLARALHRKWAAVARGEGVVSSTCQVPGIREKYAALGLHHSRGIFVEIGAFDGESWSNTSFLADLGWRGVYVEPVPMFCRRARWRHFLNDVSIENVAIAGGAGEADINLMGSLTTLNAATAEHYKQLHWAQRQSARSTKLRIKTAPLEDVLARNEVPKNFDLMVVDVEGAEEAIIEGLLGSRWRPRVLIVELCDVHPDFISNKLLSGSHARVRQSLISAGYNEFFVHQINTIFALAQPLSRPGAAVNETFVPGG